MDPAPNLVLVGPMGAGKSAIGRRLAARLRMDFIDLDRAIEASTGASIATIFDCEGEPGFRARERELLSEVLADRDRVVATGGGVVLDPANRSCLRARGYVVWLQVPAAEQLRRLAADRARPLLQGHDRADVLRRLAAEREPLYAEVADLAFDTGGLDPAGATTRLAARIAAHWPGANAA